MRVVVLGAGVSGHTAASFLKKMLGKKHDVIVVTPSQYYQWIPSNIWVGVGKMKTEQVRFKLEKVYNRWGIIFKQAKAIALYPEDDSTNSKGLVEISYTSPDKMGKTEKVEYDYLVNATGPQLKFDATEGLGPDKNTVSVCSCGHATHAWEELQKSIELMKQGKSRRYLLAPVTPEQLVRVQLLNIH